MESVESQIAEWRAYVVNAPGVNGHDVDELEDHLRRQIAELNAAQIWDRPLVTEVTPFTIFYPAEGSHQGYFRQNPGQGYCQAVVAPKVAKFRKQFLDRLKS